MTPEMNAQHILLPSVEDHLRKSSASERIQTFLDLTPEPALATSFGAQSAVLLHLVTRIKPDIPVVYVSTRDDQGVLPPYLGELVQHLNLQLHVVHVNPGEDKLQAFNRALETLGITGWISGIRQTQSWTRASARILETQDGRLKLHPIVDWTNEQVADYFARFKLPMHPVLQANFNGSGIPRSPAATDGAVELSEGEFPRECGLHRRFARIESEGSQKEE